MLRNQNKKRLILMRYIYRCIFFSFSLKNITYSMYIMGLSNSIQIFSSVSRVDLEVQLMQQNYCDGVLSNYWNTLLGEQISQHTAMSMSRSALGFISNCYIFIVYHTESEIYILVCWQKKVSLTSYTVQMFDMWICSNIRSI